MSDLEAFEKANRQKVWDEIYAEIQKEADFYDEVLRLSKFKNSGIDQDGKQRPMYWFYNRRAEIRRKWNI